MRNSLPFLSALFCLSSLLATGQNTQNPTPDSRFQADLLVVVAHPDDESEIGGYLARAILDEHKRVAVVYGTRGNQGGNVVGQEQAAALGAIREIEAHRAWERFGVSNIWFLNGTDTPGQNVLGSLESWNHGDSLGKLVRLVRLIRPKVIATWLPIYSAGENHGDHQAAGVLATEAFDLAGDPTSFPEQVTPPRNRYDIGNFTEGLRPWQAQKLYYFSDASNTEFLDGKGPRYAVSDISPSQHISYARIAAESCAEHLTQGDSGMMAKKGLQNGDLGYLSNPVKFAFGKSYVPGSVTGDLFEGVREGAIPFHKAPSFIQEVRTKVTMEFGGSWYFYRQFWQAHGLERLAGFVSPEVAVNFDTFLTVPVVVENPTDGALPVSIFVDLPEGLRYIRRPPEQGTVPAHSNFTFDFEMRTPAEHKSAVKLLKIRAEADHHSLGSLDLDVHLDGGALPQ
jgi:LmbE family N-acetylglucosaminyl deacetylase